MGSHEKTLTTMFVGVVPKMGEHNRTAVFAEVLLGVFPMRNWPGQIFSAAHGDRMVGWFENSEVGHGEEDSGHMHA
jgi:hypothetical protein